MGEKEYNYTVVVSILILNGWLVNHKDGELKIEVADGFNPYFKWMVG